MRHLLHKSSQLVATRFVACRFLVFNQELDQEPGFEHDHEIIDTGEFQQASR